MLTSYEKGNDRYEYTYNTDGLRTGKKIFDNGVLTQTQSFVWADGILLGVKVHTESSNSDSYIRYIYDENNEAIGMAFDNYTFLFIKNLQGDVVSLVKAETDELCVNLTYDAWGKVSVHPTSQNIGAIIGAVLVTALNSFTYRGYFTDYDTGLYYLQSRYYDPEIGRFINADDTDYLAADNTPISYNLFAYCKNNPVNSIDLNGKTKTPLAIFREKAQKEVINQMKDMYAKIILSHWFYGGGKYYDTGKTRTDWGKYMLNNSLLKQRIIKYAKAAISSGKKSFYKKMIACV